MQRYVWLHIHLSNTCTLCCHPAKERWLQRTTEKVKRGLLLTCKPDMVEVEEAYLAESRTHDVEGTSERDMVGEGKGVYALSSTQRNADLYYCGRCRSPAIERYSVYCACFV